MKAVSYHHFGGPEIIQEDEVAPPRIAAGQVIINVVASSVNVADWKLGMGFFKDFVKLPFPIIPGLDFAGIVTQVGEGVSAFADGDQVCGAAAFDKAGAYAEMIAVPADIVAKAPRSIPLATAAAVPLAALTAWFALLADDQGHIQQGQSVLIHGASGGVGTFAVQLARWRGAHVIATSSAHNHDYLLSLGANETIDYRTTRFEDVVQNVDAVMDFVGGDLAARSLPLLRRGGRLVLTADFPGPEVIERAKAGGVHVSFAHAIRDQNILKQIVELIDAGTLRVVVSQEYPLAQAGTALAKSREGHTRGKVLLTIGNG